MKTLDPIIDDKDITTKEYVDNLVPKIASDIGALDSNTMVVLYEETGIPQETLLINADTLNGKRDIDFTPTSDNNLLTTSKNIVGAINEVCQDVNNINQNINVITSPSGTKYKWGVDNTGMYLQEV